MSIDLNPIALMQADVAARLGADEYFGDITVLSERDGDIENGINRALKVLTAKSGKIGVAVVVGTVQADVPSPNLPGPLFGQSSLEVTIFEHVTFNAGSNGTGKAAVDIGVRVLQILHHYSPGGLGSVITAADNALRPVGLLEPGVIGYKARVNFSADGMVRGKVQRVSISPTSGVAPQSVTLTCGTSGASIYYTLDKSYPCAGNGTLYTEAFNVTEAALLRAVAYKSGYVASDATAVEYS